MWGRPIQTAGVLAAMREHFAKIQAGDAGVWLSSPQGFYRVHGELAEVLFLERFVARDRVAIAGAATAARFDRLAEQGLACPPEKEVANAS